MRDLWQQQLADVLAATPSDTLGTVGVLDETSCRKWGDETPGVQRQYLGCVGKVDNGIVTVHVGVAKGRFQAVRDADLYLPTAWDADRPRCQATGIPDDVRYRPKWRMALDQLLRQHGHGISNALAAPLTRLLAVAFRRWTIEHGFRLGKQEAGLMHYEGRDSTGLIRHLMLALAVLGFVARQTERLRGEKSAGNSGASMPGVKPAVRSDLSWSARSCRSAACKRGHLLSAKTERPGDEIPQETAA